MGGGGGGATTIVTPQGRLTLTTGVPITTADVTGSTTLYYTPTAGRFVPIWNGSVYVMTDIGGELSQLTTDATKSPAAVAASKVYDVFVWSDGGTIRATRGPAWTSDTNPGSGAGTSEREFVNGIYVNKNAITNGPAARFGTLVGSVRSDGSSQLRDTVLFRWVSNVYNAVPRSLQVNDSTNSWTYTTAAFRQANGNAANQVDILQSLGGGLLSISAHHLGNNSVGSAGMAVGVGIDQTTTNNASAWGQGSAGAGQAASSTASYRGYPGIGRHFAAWLEESVASGTTTWYGNAGLPGIIQTGMAGDIFN